MLNDLPRFLSHEAHKYIFYGWVRAFRMNFPDVSVENAIVNFMKYHSVYNEVLTDDSFNAESARVTFYRLDSQFNDLYKKTK